MISNHSIKLKLFTKDDRDLYKKIYRNSGLMKYITKPLDESVCDRSFDLILKKMKTKNYLLSPCVIQQNDTGTNLGVISLQTVLDQQQTCKIGIIILKSHQRKGYAHYAKSLLITTAFQLTDTKQIIAVCDKNNIAANLANKKLAFKKIQEYLDKNDNTTKIKWQISKQDYNDK